MPAPQPLQILLVEDDPAAVTLVRIALQECGFQFYLHIAADGEQALTFLNDGQPRLDLVLQDLNLAEIGAFEVLRQARDRLRSVPVVVVSTSNAPEDKRRASMLGAVAYLEKPNSLDGWRNLSMLLKGLTQVT